ncbi:hypothetical protein L208DRAFT_1356852 [Tricholoma matsutake]|nr:hypothetical protein L208DRAFT_1356840 [Tricholoma matsutake 945]KAF8236870.1 hypothetical protein L208DRAFT_1356852 [Tricholoma matsutake 945]
MGKLNIAHHKSYHPYRRDNIEKVRRDEEEARQKEAQEEGRMQLADSEARMDLLRDRAGLSGKPKKKQREEDLDKVIAAGSMQAAVLPTTNGHINFFEDLEQVNLRRIHLSVSNLHQQNAIATAIKATKKADPSETDKGVPLAPSAKDLKPWYSEKRTDSNYNEEEPDERRNRDTARKSMHDPLTSITRQLASRSSTSTSTSVKSYRPRPLPPSASPEVAARLTRESSERERALALIQRKKREMQGSMTPSTVRGSDDGGYADVFNRKEVEEAHRGRERRWDHRQRGWDDDLSGRYERRVRW